MRTDVADDAATGGPPVRIVRSARRRRTAAARVVDGVVEVRVPAGLPAAREADVVQRLVARMGRARGRTDADLAARARTLARRHGLPEPAAIRWVDNQRTRWGSCTPATGTVRLSRRLAEFPGWVVDYVIVHELAHLAAPGHGPDFWELAGRYPLTERARGYLIAKGGECAEGGERAAGAR